MCLVYYLVQFSRMSNEINLKGGILDRIEAKGNRLAEATQDSTRVIKYKASEKTPGYRKDLSERMIKVQTNKMDPLEPAKFKHRKMPHGPVDAPVPLEQSPPRKLTAEDQKAWKVPPCISNWKNNRGYVIALDKRLQADGRGLVDHSVNEKFANLAEDLYIAERKAREEIRLRNEVLKMKKIEDNIVVFLFLDSLPQVYQC